MMTDCNRKVVHRRLPQVDSKLQQSNYLYTIPLWDRIQCRNPKLVGQSEKYSPLDPVALSNEHVTKLAHYAYGDLLIILQLAFSLAYLPSHQF